MHFKYTSEFANKFIILESLLQIYSEFQMNISILKVCFKYTSEFKDRYISSESLLQGYFWVSKINTSMKVYLKNTSKIEKKLHQLGKSTSCILLSLNNT